jgi:hypothetical protein
MSWKNISESCECTCLASGARRICEYVYVYKEIFSLLHLIVTQVLFWNQWREKEACIILEEKPVTKWLLSKMRNMNE